MKPILLSILTFLVFATQWTFATTLPDEDLNYKVTYKWGIINKQAGRATLSLRNTGSTYHATLVARSEPWADHFYRVRDTLISHMNATDLTPILYEKIAHENGKYSHDIIQYTVSDDTYTGNCTRIRQKDKDKPRTTSTLTLTANGKTVDMLSVFYHLRSLDFPSMTAGHTLTMNIFSGKKKERLDITFHGIKKIEVDDIDYNTYHVSFVFTSHGGKKSSDDIDAWISADSRRIPVKLEGRLPIGKIRCLYSEKQ